MLNQLQVVHKCQNIFFYKSPPHNIGNCNMTLFCEYQGFFCKMYMTVYCFIRVPVHDFSNLYIPFRLSNNKKKISLSICYKQHYLIWQGLMSAILYPYSPICREKIYC